ncbi:2-hydroxyacyl-CoA dehydratase [Natroniella sulfidigena]|uniref:2-hydroxyacyl-CoA dehydratase family protein n=1 Tax=Natroniella sulfidigena TaxID=723921 RepID=UPI00200A470D|nr:2-hydroxyacyl-CoA dehydratase [Natroniella sulfidigena]MCK8818163.1 2-hydroxyacyl-CoA dehydratase [Natroniella sulfidigena]
MSKIGITTTVPSEILFAAGYQVIDLNNIFVTADDYSDYIDLAERDGFPKSCCAWTKGIYGVCVAHDIKEVVGVISGDCSNTEALAGVLEKRGVKIHPFSYPHGRKLADVKAEIERFRECFGVSQESVEEYREKFNQIRALAEEIDRLTYQDYKASGFENHLYQVSCSDFNGDPDLFKEQLAEKITEIEAREAKEPKLRLGLIGVPPMTVDLYQYVTEFGARIIYNEVQREFAFPRWQEADNIYQLYHDYTYPYDLEFRLQELNKQIQERKLDGIIHYTQAFCHRNIEQIVIKDELELPILNIKGDKLNQLDSRTKLRLEAFLDMLGDLKEGQA